MKRTAVFLAVLIQFIFIPNIFAHPPEITNGINYLSTIQNPDGSWGSDTSSTDILPATASVINTLNTLDETYTTGYADAISWLENQPLETTDYLAERIHALSVAGTDSDVLLSYLDDLSYAWGGHEDYSLNNLDTALALLALKRIDYPEHGIIAAAAEYLTENQNSDGGWGFTAGDESNVYMTAIVLNTLAQLDDTYTLHTAVNDGAAYLLANQNIDGGFGSSPSTVYETALAFEALIASGADILAIAPPAKNYLVSNQLLDGSWDEDPYSTALAVRALSNIKPNLAIAATDISFSKTMPQEGETVTITATVHNTGIEDASNIAVRFFVGDPSSGGEQIGTDQVISFLAAGASAQASVSYTFTGTGGRTIFVRIDPQDMISETIETDNEACTRFWVATGPDLALFSGDIKPSTYAPAPEEPFAIEYTIRNMGETDVGAFVVSLYDGAPSQGGTLLHTVTLSGLAGAASRIETVGVTLTEAGSHALYLIVDPGNTIPELSETNNTGSVAVQVDGVQGQADLSVTAADITFTPSRPFAGDTVQITARIRNQGAEDAQGFTVELFDGAPESDGTLIHGQTLSLAPGEEGSLTSEWTISEGIHDLYVIVDRDNMIVEINETNNRATRRVMTDMVDISVSSADLVFTPSWPVAGDAVTLGITVHNRGIKDTGPFSLAIYDGPPDEGGMLLNTLPVDNVAGDGSTTLFYNFTAEPRTYRFYAMADSENQVAELSEGNNQAIRSIIIKGEGETYGPELVPIKFEFLDDTATDSQTLAISGTAQVTFRNKGDEKIEGPFDVLVFEDTDRDGRYTEGVDTALGVESNNLPLWPNGANMVVVPLSGTVRFLNAPLSALVDSADAVAEQDEENNIIVSSRECERPIDPITPVVEWSWRWQPKEYILGQPPVVTNITDDNGDGKIDANDTPDIVFATFGGPYNYVPAIAALSGDTGEEIFFNLDQPVGTRPFVAAGDIDNDGLPEFVVPRRGSGGFGILVYEHDGTLKWDNQAIVNAWNSSHSPYLRATIQESGVPVIADIDADGQPEIVMGGTVINSDGSIRWVRDARTATGTGCFSYWYASTVADLDMDGKQEVVAGNAAYNHDGTVKWYDSSLSGSVSDGINAIGNLDDDPYPEVVLVTYSTESPFVHSGARVYLLEHDGSVKWGPVYVEELEPNEQSVGLGGPPIIADFDGDGEPEIGLKGFNRYFILDRNGNLKNSLYIPYQSDGFYSAPTVFDLNGDERPEVLINSDRYFRIFDGKDGTLLYEDSYAAAFNSYQNVIIADVDGDDQAEAVVVGCGYMSNGDAIRVYGSANNDWINARRIWNQPTYHVTNVNDDCTIPQYEGPSWLLNNTYRCQVPVGEYENPYLLPNLTASYLRGASEGILLNLTVRVGNGGAKDAPAGVLVEFYNGLPETGTLIGSASTTKTLDPGEYQDVTYSWNGAGEGPLHISAVVNGDNAIDECLLDDNETEFDYTLEEGLPDLVIVSEDIMLPAGPYYEGSLIPVTASIKNIGSTSASNILVRFYNGNPAAGGVQIGPARTVQSIGPGGSEAIVFTFDTLGYFGPNVLYIWVDPENIIEEESETNNLALFSIEIGQPVLPNLTVTTEDIQISPLSPQEGEEVQITASIRNRGTAVGNIPVHIYLGNPTAGGALVSTQTIYPILLLGETATVEATLDTAGNAGEQSIYITVDPVNSIAESNEDDNSASQALFIESAGLTSTLSLDKAIYQAAEDMAITVTASDASGLSRSLTLDLFVQDSAGDRIANISQAGPVMIDPNGTVTILETWNTGTALAGSYIVVAEFSETGRVVSRKSSAFTIAADERLSSAITTDCIQYNPGQTATLTGVITSLSGNFIFENLTAQIHIKDPGGAIIATETRAILSLMPGASFTFTAIWNTSSHPKGIYIGTLGVLSGQTVVSSSTTNFEIVGSSNTGAGLIGTLTAAPSSVCQGQDELLAYAITNNGNESVSGLAVSVIIADPDTEEAKETFTAEVDIPVNTTLITNVTASTTNLPPKTYLAILQVTSDTLSQPKTLSSDTFEVLPSLEATMTMADHTNLLVWVNDKCPPYCEQYRERHQEQSGTPLEEGDENDECGGSQECCNKRCIRVDLLKSILDEAVTDYHIVYDRKDFEEELRSPYYTDILILGDRHPLTDHFDAELREKVYSGTGLISSLWLRHGDEESLFGVDYKGTLPDKYPVIQAVESPISVEEIIEATGKAHRIEAEGGATVAAFIESTHGDEYPAIVLNNYGVGKTVYYAFDLGLTLNDDNCDQLAALIKNSIAHVHRPQETDSYAPYRFIPVELTVKSLGGSFDLKITETFPECLDLYCPILGEWITESPWTITMHLEPDETGTIALYVLAPDMPGVYALETEIGFLAGGVYTFFDTLSVDVGVGMNTSILISDIISELNVLSLSGQEKAKAANAIKNLEAVQERGNATEEDIEKNIHNILKAVESLLFIDSIDTTDIRLMLDALMRTEQARYYFFVPPE
jgi:subtilase family serine protease